MYSEVLLEHFRNPQNVGELAPPAITVEVSNPACGDILRLSARFEAGRVAQAAFKTRGCAASIAAGSALTGLIVGRSVSDLRQLKAGAVEQAVGGLIPESRHAAVLCVDAVQSLIREAGKAT